MNTDNHDKKELAVAALRNGTVIDHIPASSLFKVVKILDIPSMSNAVTIGFNLSSPAMGKKGIIKVADMEFPQEVINRIAIAAPGAVINIIRDYEVAAKQPVVLPDTIEGLVVCNNPKCITRNEPIPSRFEVIDTDGPTLRCHYCEHETSGNDIIIA